VTYSLSPLVTIWMSLYSNLLRVRKWISDHGVGSPSISESLEFLCRQNYPPNEKSLVLKTRKVYNSMNDGNCKNSILALEDAWKKAVQIPDVQFVNPTKAVSLIDFPRYRGAFWPHNDIAVYLSEFRRAAVMKVSDSRFQPLREKLSMKNQGMDPFIGTSFQIAHSKLHPIFNRIRCSKADPVDPSTFSQLQTFQNQIAALEGAVTGERNLRSLISGRSPFSLEDYIIARYGNSYALMKFVCSNAILKESVRQKEYDYSFTFNVDGVDVKGWMFRNSLFDPVVEPERFRGSKVRFAAFVLVGQSSLEEYPAHLHVVSIEESEQTAAPDDQAGVNPAPSISSIEEELMRLSRPGPEGAQPLEVTRQLEEELEGVEQPKTAPVIRAVIESAFPLLQWRLLTILASNRSREFKLGELWRRLHQEGLQVELSKVRDALRELNANGELVYENVFGDRWYLNPIVRIHPRANLVSQDAVEQRVVEVLKNEVSKIAISQVVDRICRADNRINPRDVRRAIGRLHSKGIVMKDKNQKCRLNPYPKKSGHLHPAVINHPAAKVLEPYVLDETQVIKLPNFVVVKPGSFITIQRGGRVVKNRLVFPHENASAEIRAIIQEIRRGKYSSLEFEEMFGGKIRVSFVSGELTGAYWNRNLSGLNRFMASLKGR
jgi:hypothetical protein